MDYICIHLVSDLFPSKLSLSIFRTCLFFDFFPLFKFYFFGGSFYQFWKLWIFFSVN